MIRPAVCLCALALAVLPAGGAAWARDLLQAPTDLIVQHALQAAMPADMPAGTRLMVALPQGSPETAIRVIGVQQDLRSGIFAAILEDAPGRQTTIRGRVQAVADVPVPIRPLNPGAIAQAADFELRTLPIQALGRYTLTDPDLIEGREIRRLLPEGRPVQSQSLQDPRAVKRGEKLTLIYRGGMLEVSAPARAMEDAAADMPVRVQNLNSGKTITGTAKGGGLVEIER